MYEYTTHVSLDDRLDGPPTTVSGWPLCSGRGDPALVAPLEGEADDRERTPVPPLLRAERFYYRASQGQRDDGPTGRNGPKGCCHCHGPTLRVPAAASTCGRPECAWPRDGRGAVHVVHLHRLYPAAAAAPSTFVGHGFERLILNLSSISI